MGLWKPPEKVMLPSQFEDAATESLSASLFEYDGHMPDGRQVLAYLFAAPPDASGHDKHLAAIHEFDADGHHQLVRTCLLTDKGIAGRSESFHALFDPYIAAGWRPGDIWVRPFLVELNGERHGFVYSADGDGLESECECEEGCGCERAGVVYFYPFWFPFHSPYDSGSYDT